MVPTWGIRGHFRASCGYERAAETAVGGRGETADRRTDVGSRGSVARVARAHGVNANQVFQWRRQYRQRLLGPGNTEAVSLLPVQVTEALAQEAVSLSGEAERRAALGMIQVKLPKGQVRITGRIDAESLRVVLECLLG
jgi:transposase